MNASTDEKFETFMEPENSLESNDNSRSEEENSMGLMFDRDNIEPPIENIEDRSVEKPVSIQEAVKNFEGNENIEDKIETANLHENIAVNLNKIPITKNSDGKYGCRFCDKTFVQAQAAQIHQRIHTGEKPFACRFCDKTFTQSFSVRRHERTHTGEKPFACRYCQYKTSNSGNIKTHERTHNKINTEDKNTDENVKRYSKKAKSAIKSPKTT